jgi:hypothetical protein
VSGFDWNDEKNEFLKSTRGVSFMEGVPYQTLIASTLHKFVTGKLKEAV